MPSNPFAHPRLLLVFGFLISLDVFSKRRDVSGCIACPNSSKMVKTFPTQVLPEMMGAFEYIQMLPEFDRGTFKGARVQWSEIR